MRWRTDPGPCPICGAQHAACSSSSGQIEIPQVPSRDAMTATVRDIAPSAVAPDASFATGTYRGKRKP